MYFWIFLLSLAWSYGLYLYFYKRKNIFQELGIPHVTPWPIIGNIAPVLFKTTSLPQFLSNLYNLNPEAKYVGYYECETPVIVIRDPELIKLIGIKNFESFYNRRGFAKEGQDEIFGNELVSLRDEKWRKMRSVLSPSFSASRFKIFFELVSQKVEDLTQIAQKQDESDMGMLVQRIVFDIVFASAYGISTNCVQEQDNELFMIGYHAFDLEDLERKKFLLLYLPFVYKLFKLRFCSDKAIQLFKSIVEIGKSKNEVNKVSQKGIVYAMNNPPETINKLSMKDMVAQVAIILGGSLTTLSGSLTFLYYQLAVNPQVQEKLQREIDSIQNKCKDPINDDSISNQVLLEDINNLKYLDAVVKEGLRIFSTIPFLERVCTKDFELPPALPDSKPFVAKPGTFFIIPIDSIQTDPNNFKEPEKFNPERFYDENEQLIKNYTFLPFGIGPKHCIANRFSLQTIKVVTFFLFAKCNVQVCPNTPIPLKLTDTTITALPEQKIMLRVNKRNK